MNKKLITALIAITLSISATIQAAPMAQADQAPAIAILDSALDTSLPIFKDRIAYEVCILEWNSCPNGKSFMEGVGSTTLPLSILNNGQGFDHGTQMASIVASIDPNVKIVFIRIIGNTPYGARQISNEVTVTNALSWVLANKDKYNIKSVAMSQGHHNLNATADYCPSTPNTKNLVTSLTNSGVATFFPAGNARDYSKIDWPACIDESISIGATDQYDGVALYSNYDPVKLDLYALGNMKVTLPGGKIINGAGSSISVQVAATQWALLKTAKPTLSQDQLISLLSQTSIPVRGSKGQIGKLINLSGALSVK
jgi:hypothetical protein